MPSKKGSLIMNRYVRHHNNRIIYVRRRSTLRGLAVDLLELLACLFESTVMVLTFAFIALILGFKVGHYELFATIAVTFVAWVIYKD